MGLLTGLLIAGAATQGLGAILQHKAAGKASDQQQASGREALALQQQMYDQTRADLAPYRTAGGQGLTALSAYLGLPSAPAGAAPSAAAAPAGPAALPRAPGGAPVGPAGLTFQESWAQARMPHPGAPRTSAASVYHTPAGTSGQVVLRSPTGQTQAVPADQVDYYLARGATRV